ncbi:hypothetical protein ADL15_16995 [Actinoplanes awajinensis subsp. mycoplanecinus]|uniref:Uncharacterized protein n=1 Tax=Actinoplanes awajinensis subsp. mycoplanecinus TaxID=135947 RepID=A0A0X3UMR3_9ACTN|nr:hypothetical protein ADL15_16995 [Actinoplanes awajinensis subsp. mycoplanecinus]
MSEDELVVHRPANRHANRSRSDVGMMSELGRWVAAMTIRPTARPRATRSRSSDAKSSRSVFLPTVAEKYAISSTPITYGRNASRGVIFRRPQASRYA